MRLYPPRKKVLTLDEELALFLEKWESERTKLLKKYKLRNKQYAAEKMLVMYHRKKVDHYTHELKMLQELRRRAGL